MRLSRAGARTCRGPGARRRRSPTGRPGRSGSLSACWPRSPLAARRWRRPAPRSTGSLRKSRRPPIGSPRRSRPRYGRAAELTAAYRAYQSGLTELRVDDPDELIELVTEWVVTGDGENPARRVIDDAARSAVDALGRQDARLSARRDAFTTTAAELTAEIGRLEAGGHDAPARAAYEGSAGPRHPAGSATMEGDRLRARHARRTPSMPGGRAGVGGDPRRLAHSRWRPHRRRRRPGQRE